MEEEYKICYSCKEPKLLSEFNRNRAKSDGLHTTCRSCMKLYNREHYKKNSSEQYERVKAARKIRWDINRREVLSFLAINPCTDCGIEDIRVLEFDHIDPSLKSHGISEMLSDYNWKAISKEIEKCEVRCANCHRIRTGIQYGTYRDIHKPL